MPAEFHLVSNESGTAELKLTFPLRAPSDLIPPPSSPNTDPSSCGSECLKKANKSRILRRERRAAERAAAEKNAAERAAAEKNAAENSAEVKTFIKKVDSDISAAEKAVTETAACKTKGDDGSLASTSCIASSRCEHQYGVPTPVIPDPESVVEEHPPPLPLCHYCCHRGSGDKPVHYYQQCLCLEKVCSCYCYCDEEQLEHRKLFFRDGFSGSMVPVDLKDRPEAKLVAEKRIGQWPIFPCENEDCARPP